MLAALMAVVSLFTLGRNDTELKLEETRGEGEMYSGDWPQSYVLWNELYQFLWNWKYKANVYKQISEMSASCQMYQWRKSKVKGGVLGD